VNSVRKIISEIVQVGGFTLFFGAIIALVMHLYEQARDKTVSPPADDSTRSRWIDKLALKIAFVLGVIVVIILNHVVSQD
jgi:archaellum biogenesis protein FlaJ (TadC family)